MSLNLEDYTSLVGGVFGGCCSNAFSLEMLMNQNPKLGSALTFCQLVFIAIQSLPAFVVVNTKSFPPKFRLKPRNVPIRLWALCVLLLTSIALLNNWAFAYRVPVSIMILIRSAGLGVAMCFGYIFMKKRYSSLQVFSVILVTVGVALATLSRPPPKRPTKASSPHDIAIDAEAASLYLIGVALLLLSILLSGALGALQEKIFKDYGPHWQESVFYTHLLSIPVFVFLLPEVRSGFKTSFSPFYVPGVGLHKSSAMAVAWLLVNLVTQNLCVKGVNRLTTRMSSVSANLVLTGRKALSLCLSVWWFDSTGWNSGMTVGALLVFFGSMLYGLAERQKTPSKKIEGGSQVDGGAQSSSQATSVANRRGSGLRRRHDSNS